MINNSDRYYIERKYHDPEKEFNAFARRAYHGIGYINESGLDDEQLLIGLNRLEKEIGHLPHPIARAKAIQYVLENERLYINKHDYFTGLYSPNRLANQITFKKWEKESLLLRDPEAIERSKDFNNAGAVMIWTDYDHVVPDWKSLTELGFTGIRERARAYRKLHEKNGTLNEETSAFFEGIEIQYSAIIALLDRMYNIAKEQTFEKAPTITACLKNLRDGKPTDFYEALQLIYIYFIISEHIDSYQVRSLGNGLDQTLLPFYENDIASGKYTKDEIKNFLSYFLLQWSAIGNYWGQPFYMGGTNLDGSTKYNELSKLILETYDELEIYNPKIQLKINENTPVTKSIEVKIPCSVAFLSILSPSPSSIFLRSKKYPRCKILGEILEKSISSAVKVASAPAYVKKVRCPPVTLITSVKLVLSLVSVIPVRLRLFSAKTFFINSPFSSLPIFPITETSSSGQIFLRSIATFGTQPPTAF